LLFDLALARRMSGKCKEAVEIYRQFLDAKPPDDAAFKAKAGIEKCPAEPEPPVLAPPPPPPPPPPPVRASEPWYRDRLANTLAISGAAVALGGGVLYLLARNAASDTFHATSLPTFDSDRDAASRYQIASWIATGLGSALIVAGAVRYASRPTETISVAPTRGGAALALELAF
jgi:hypothetical protein